MSTAFFFPGQGSQSLNMMSGFNDMPVVKETFKQASEALNQDLWTLMNGEDSAALNETVNTQPLMLTAGIATWRVYQQLHGQLPVMLAGHSLGEYTALVAAGSLAFHDAVKLVRLRAQLMQEAVPAGEGAMAAILGLDDDIVRQVCLQAQNELSGTVAEAVNYNSPGQVVIAGTAVAINRACELAKAAGAKRALPLPVSVPSHCCLMKPAATKLAAAMEQI
ncbi:(acyl-carrier-protein) S-malonyltransferase, partial [Snodgrassella alvi SCGC AB-598-P14]